MGFEVLNDQKLRSDLADITNEKSETTYKETSIANAYMTIIDDDGSTAIWTKLKPISDELGVPFTIALYKESSIPNEQALYLQNTLGWEITSHGLTHTALTDFTGDALEYELAESKRILKNRGYNVRNIVYPYGQFNKEVKNIASKYYNCAAMVGGSGDLVNVIPVLSFRLGRVALGYSAGANNTLDYYKSKVDTAIAKKGWVIFMTHCGTAEHDATQNQYLHDVISYAQANGVNIVTLQDGYELFGNLIESSNDSTTGYLRITKDGRIYNYGEDSIACKYSTKKLKSSEPISSFDPNKITVMSFNASDAAGYPGGGSGILETHNCDWVGNAFQMFMPYNSDTIYKRRWDTGTNTWLVWEQFVTKSYVDAVPKVTVANMNTYTANSLITDFPANKITICAVNNAGGSGFPGNVAGMVTTYRLAGNGWDYQEFKKYNSNELWSRYTSPTDGSWTAWTKISAV